MPRHFLARHTLQLQLLGRPLAGTGLLCALTISATLAQQAERVLVTGTLLDAAGRPLDQVSVGVEGQPAGTTSDNQGRFSLRVPRPSTGGKAPVLVLRRLGYKTQRIALDLTEQLELRLTLTEEARSLGNVTVRGSSEAVNTREQVSIMTLDPRSAKVMPSPFGDFNAILKTLPGVTSTNELTSTYSVRGGNYEENLVYVNGFEIYRPFLVTAAAQEGLSFINPDLVHRVEFSTGGWQPRFGDKLSSVLNIEYKQPTRFGASASASLVGGTMHVEAASPSKRVSYLAGIRYKNARNILRAQQQQQGVYNPAFYDGQALITAALGPQDNLLRTSLGLLTTFAHNAYRFSPETGESTFSTAANQYTRLRIGYVGLERMQYDTYQGGLNLRHSFRPDLQVEMLAGLLYSREFEYRDVEADYSLGEVTTEPDSKDYNKTVRERSLASRFDHSRNYLTAQVATLETRGAWTPGQAHTIRWGLKAGREKIDDTLNEYSFVDSADFVPDARRTRLRSDLRLESTRYQGYAQHMVAFDSLRTLTYGARLNYWTVNGQLTVSPRVQYSFISPRRSNVSWKAAAGVYVQPPFYRELRAQIGVPQDQTGYLNPALRAQRSWHFIVGNEVRFQQWERPFKFTGEAYYKYLTDVVPYDIDNVRLRYFAKNNARAYAAGIDARVSGEFVKGVESWFSLGLLTTRENVAGDSINTYDGNTLTGRVPKGYIRRPSDQRVNVGAFFQDDLPGIPSVKGYVNLVFGSGLPFSPPGLPDLRGTNKLTRSYKRVDMGFSKVLALRTTSPGQEGGKAVRLESLWLGLEILNILGADNLAGYNYLQDLNGQIYSVPNFLSQRVVNVRAIVRF